MNLADYLKGKRDTMVHVLSALGYDGSSLIADQEKLVMEIQKFAEERAGQLFPDNKPLQTAMLSSAIDALSLYYVTNMLDTLTNLNKKEHVCGLEGFGLNMDDVCPACQADDKSR